MYSAKVTSNIVWNDETTESVHTTGQGLQRGSLSVIELKSVSTLLLRARSARVAIRLAKCVARICAILGGNHHNLNGQSVLDSRLVHPGVVFISIEWSEVVIGNCGARRRRRI